MFKKRLYLFFLLETQLGGINQTSLAKNLHNVQLIFLFKRASNERFSFLLDDSGENEHDCVAEDEEEGVHHHSRVRVQRLTRVPQPVFLPAAVGLSDAAYLHSRNNQPFSCSLYSFLQLSAAAYPFSAIISFSLSALLQLSAAAYPMPCNYQLQQILLPAYISFSHVFAPLTVGLLPPSSPLG